MTHANDSLSWGDALFLYLERQGMPLNIASVHIFEGDIPLADCREYVRSKIPLLPRYGQRLTTPPLNLGLPCWENDPTFDVHNHLHEVMLKRGTDAEVKAAAGKVLSNTLDRNRPLWDLTFLHGVKGNCTAMVTRVHHCLADGIAGVGLMNLLMDATPIVHRSRKKISRAPEPRRDPATMLLDWSMNSYFSTVQRLLKMQAEVLELVHKIVLNREEWPVNDFQEFLPELVAPTEPLPFNMICNGPQKIAWAEAPMEDIEAIKHALGATVNDVALGLVTSVLRRYVELRGVSTRKRLLRIMVPVNVRPNGDSHVGNRISLVPVTIPLDIRSPKKLIAAIHQRTSFIKHAHIAEFVGLAGSLLGAIPTAVQAVAGPIASALPITPFNLVCTNVPGPQVPLYFMGHKMLRWYPYVPIGGDMAMNCAILTYNGTAHFGFNGDVHAAPDLARLEQFFKLSLAELRQAAGLKSPRQKTRKPSKKKASPITPEPTKAGPEKVLAAVAS